MFIFGVCVFCIFRCSIDDDLKKYAQTTTRRKKRNEIIYPKKGRSPFFHTYIGLILCIFRSFVDHHHFLMFDY